MAETQVLLTNAGPARQQLKKILAQGKANKHSDEYQLEIEAVTIEECLPIITNVLSRLPAELRGMIYDCLWDEETVEEYNFGFRGKYNQYTWCRNVFWSIPKMVGRQFAEESVKHFYRTEYVVVHEPGLFPATRIGYDIFQLGLNPLHYIRKVTLSAAAIGWRGLRRVDLSDELTGLLELLARPNFTLQYKLYGRGAKTSHIELALSQFKPIYLALKDHGDVSIVSTGGGYSPELDLTRYYEMELVEWRMSLKLRRRKQSYPLACSQLGYRPTQSRRS
ncbi:hypothetical protein EJ04DRAFT_566753 [Polyplosphaeria fusca]|uniref:Uncharacterized protein n=1 Tax=Polyplosphaeria fusca TaxID=682080 RepID=A0A9P4UWZ8_9PLEO|nr:hypothetical protein EJ04DRAFT_566753 [Polyplosphaeria fusca]